MAARRLSSDSSPVQAVGLVAGSEGVPTTNNVMDLRIGIFDGSEYLPR